MFTSTIITVVRDPAHILGKHIERAPDGTISKQSAVSVSFGIAVQHEVQTPEALAALLTAVSNDPHAAVINSCFKGIGIGEEFIILSSREIEKRLGLPQCDRTLQIGIHTIEHNGEPVKAVGRFKENVTASCWQLLDRDIDKHTPTQYADLTTSQWMAQVGIFLPGVEKLTYIETPSTSSRVMYQGKSLGSGNAHVWIKVNNPEGIERVRSAMVVLAAAQDMTWMKPRFSRTEKDKIVANSLTTIVDPSVWTTGRLVFDGQPTVGAGLTVAPLHAIIHRGENETLDLSAMTLPKESELINIGRKVGMTVKLDTSGLSLKLTANDLMLSTEVDTEAHGILTVGQIIERGITGKLRCQTPFRESRSWAAFYSSNAQGIPFVFDNGTNTTHWLSKYEQEGVDIETIMLNDEAFEDIGETVVIEPSTGAASRGVLLAPCAASSKVARVAVNPLAKFSLINSVADLVKQMVEERPILGEIALMGQATAIYAAPNGGKTLITLMLILEGIKTGAIDPSKLWYINMDDNSTGLVVKGRIAQEYGFHMIADGYLGFEAAAFREAMVVMIEKNTASGSIVVIDTLKKFVNTMDKRSSSQFAKVVRQFVLKGGTVIALAHVNKNPGPDGMPKYSGTTDILDDFDCGYTVRTISEDKAAGSKVVEFENIKRRGSVALSVAYRYALERDVSYIALLLSVQQVNPDELLPMKHAAAQASDAEVIAAIEVCISESVNTKMKLAEEAAKRTGVSKRSALKVIEKYVGSDPAQHRWQFKVADRGAQVFELLEHPSTRESAAVIVQAANS